MLSTRLIAIQRMNFNKTNKQEVLAVLTSNHKEVLSACRIQAQATFKKAQEVDFLRTQKEVVARALLLGCTVSILVFSPGRQPGKYAR